MLNRRQLLAGTLASGIAARTERRPNILHIMSDQQQWATIAGRSECRTPNLDRLANSGMLFERSYTPSAVCCPARAMILSGAYHWHNGVYNQVHSSPSVHRDMNPDVVLYSQRLRDAGYQLGYVGKWHASWVRGPLEFGFHEIAGVANYGNAQRDNQAHPSGVERSKEKPARTATRMMQWPGSEPFAMWGHVDGSDEATPEYYRTDCAIRMMNRFSKGQKPWHMEVHYIEPHDPYMPLKKYLDRQDQKSFRVPRSFADRFEGKPGLHRRESETWGPVTENDYRQSRAHYFALVEQLDVQIGRLLDALDQTGQADNTMVVFTTDHGDMNGAHRMWIKGWIPYEECYRVPMIVRWPGKIAPGSKTSNLVQTHDLAHTYIAAAGAAKLPYADGRSLMPLFEKPDRTDWAKEILCAYYGGEFLYTQRIAITDRFKYVFNGFDIDELYDLHSDPEEMKNEIANPQLRAHADDMRARMYEMMAKFEDPYGDVKPRNSQGEPPGRYGGPRYLPRGKRL